MILMASIIYVIVLNFLRFSASLCNMFVFLRFSACLVYSYGLISAKTGPISFIDFLVNLSRIILLKS